MMNIYTKQGDQGQTSLYSGHKVPKTDVRIHALGDIDELTSHLGKVRTLISNYKIKEDIRRVQKSLIQLMGIIANSEDQTFGFSLEEVKWIEERIDLYSQQYIHPGHFILPGNNIASAQIDIARTVVRRAERSLHACSHIPDEIKKYFNRLSDYMYTIGRVIETNLNKGSIDMENTGEHFILLEEAKGIIDSVEEYASYQNCRVSIAIVNSNGNPICIHCMDHSLLISFELSIKKAYTATALQMPTHELANLTRTGAPFEGLENMLDKQIVTIAGGFPLKRSGKTIAGVGVSGGSADQDLDLARYAQRLWEES